MLNQIVAFIARAVHGAGGMEGSLDVRDPAHLAAATLVAQTALADATLDESEVRRIEASVRKHFQLTEAEATILMADAVEKARRDEGALLVGKAVRDAFPEPEARELILQGCWEVAHADGIVHENEARLAERVAVLLGIDPEAAQRARDQASAVMRSRVA